MKRARLTTKQRVDIVQAFRVGLVPVLELAKQYNMTRQGIYRVLQKAGVDTARRQIPVSCSVCGAEVMRPRCRLRRQRHHFCSPECLAAFRRASGFPGSSDPAGAAGAREYISRYFVLLPGHVVHHENGVTADNRLENLRVFRNQGDHIRYHRGLDADPIWDGRNP